MKINGFVHTKNLTEIIAVQLEVRFQDRPLSQTFADFSTFVERPLLPSSLLDSLALYKAIPFRRPSTFVERPLLPNSLASYVTHVPSTFILSSILTEDSPLH